MGRDEMATILGRAAMDPDFLQLLKQNPAQAASKAGVSLQPDEVTMLQNMDYSHLSNFQQTLQQKRQVVAYDKNV